MSEAKRVRAFVAVPRDRMWIESARGLLERLRGQLPEASWTRPESWHVTIRFLGDVSRDTLESLAASIDSVARETVSGELLPGGPVLFPPRGRPRVAGVAFAPSPGLDSLIQFSRGVSSLAESLGVEKDRRELRPHVTLARMRDPWPRQDIEKFRAEVGAWTFPVWPLRSCVLYESRLHPAGAVHVPLAEWTLAGGQQGVRA